MIMNLRSWRRWLSWKQKRKSKLSSNISKWRNSGMIPIISNGNIFYGEGMCVGGGSEINGALCGEPWKYWISGVKILD